MSKPNSFLLKALPLSILLISQGLAFNSYAQEPESSQEVSSSGQAEVTLISTPLPNPLTLKTLLENYANQSPEISLQRANINLANSVL